jgi:hypothetical protein
VGIAHQDLISWTFEVLVGIAHRTNIAIKQLRHQTSTFTLYF